MGVGSSVHEKVGHTGQGLWKHKGLQLPAGIQHVANDLIEEGHPESEAVHLAVGIVQNWAEGHDGKGHAVSDKTKAGAAKAIAEWERVKAQAHAASGLKEAPVGVLATELSADEIGDLSLLLREDAPVRPTVGAHVRAANARGALGRAGEVVAEHVSTVDGTYRYDVAWHDGSRGDRLAEWDLRCVETPGVVRSRVRRVARVPRAAAQTRSGAPAGAGYTETKHPRGRGGKWTTVAAGASGGQVATIQRRVGGTAVDGQFGAKTTAVVRAFQRRHGLTVDGIVGAQTAAALRGQSNAANVPVGPLTAADQAYLGRPTTASAEPAKAAHGKKKAAAYVPGPKMTAGQRAVSKMTTRT